MYSATTELPDLPGLFAWTSFSHIFETARSTLFDRARTMPRVGKCPGMPAHRRNPLSCRRGTHTLGSLPCSSHRTTCQLDGQPV
jgi:hypothetical protein